MSAAEYGAGAPRFAPAALRSVAGEAAFARGSAYASEGRVRLTSIGAEGVRAEVAGSQVYQATLSGDGRRLSGACACPAFADRGFCKHLVAVALAVNATSPAEQGEVEGRRERIGAHLRSLGAESLAVKLLAWADRDRALMRELEFEDSLGSEDDTTLFERIAVALDEATVVEDYGDWRGAGALADELRAVFDQIRQVLQVDRAALALRLLDRFFEDAEDLFESVDDPNGEVGGAIAEAQELHLAACLAAKPDPVELAEALFERELGSGYGLWDGACETYADALGPAGGLEFRRLAEVAWAAQGKGDDRARLRRILDAFAQATGDVDARIKLRAADASSGRNCIEIAELCLDARRDGEARQWIEEGLWRAEDRPERGLERSAAALWRRLGEPDKAQALLWRAFERSPDLRSYQELAAHEPEGPVVADRCTALLLLKIDARQPAHWSSPSTLMVEIFCHAGRLDEAWAVVETHGCGEATLESLVRQSENSHPEKALQTHARLIDQALAYANQSSYPGVVKRLARMERISAALDRQAAHGAYVQALALKHKAKRTFIRLLNDRASWPRG